MEEGAATAGEDILTTLRRVIIPDKKLSEEEAEGGSVLDDIGGKGAASKFY